MIKAESTTGHVHYATEVDHVERSQGKALRQSCGMSSRQGHYLFPVSDDVEVTCRKCIAKAAKDAAKKAPAPRKTTAARTSTGPTTWGVFVGEDLRTWDLTKRDALKKAERIGEGATVRKI